MSMSIDMRLICLSAAVCESSSSGQPPKRMAYGFVGMSRLVHEHIAS